MKLLIISSAPLIASHDKWYAYSPYINEIKIWSHYVDEVQFCAPIWETDEGLLISEIPFNMLPPIQLIKFNIKSVAAVLNSFYSVFVNMKIIYQAIKNADHIHLRCPGNIGLLGCFVQILFPNKKKTAKYAGNWDPKSKQPWSYKLQKYILSSTFLTKNIQVLVYGEWPRQSKNCKPFFTATYSEKDKEVIQKTDFNKTIEFVFVGNLVRGKNPLYAIQLVEQLIKKGKNVNLNLYGEGIERTVLEEYIQNNQLEKNIFLKGNQNQETIKKAYQKSHFVLLPSKSEGWPKAIAEGMFWGCVPVVTAVSCVPFMLNHGDRGVLLEMNLSNDTIQLEAIIEDRKCYVDKSIKASEWSQKFTKDIFETEIKKILQS
ncbi:glycosyltransferase [Flavobacterium sp. EDS]|uniref:glycosyltransferase n=1 Tax=Flavobacterium sp. EDS TaxID=2897328 RepID=UPI001E56F132|nr:glycosyltransferase [Flavobacterium sp. EDS]MCD0473701.1 glycosyltransferase [Flavobacterium sp. EDS]